MNWVYSAFLAVPPPPVAEPEQFFSIVEDLQGGDSIILAFPMPSELVLMFVALFVAIVVVYMFKWLASWITG